MGNKILIENHSRRIDIPMRRLLCFAMFCIWQMGVIYYMGPSLNIDGRTPLPIPMGNITLLIAAGYVCSILVMVFFPARVIGLSRAATAAALLAVLGLFFIKSESGLTLLIYIQCFCCCFMIGFETATMVYFFSERSLVRHLLLAYPAAYVAVALLQNDFFRLEYASFRVLTVVMLVLLLYFFFKMPANSCPSFVEKGDGLIMPKRFFAGVFLLIFLALLLGIIAPAVAAQYEHGVFAAYLSCVVCSLAVYALYKKTGRHPIQFMPYVVGLASLGYVLLLASNYVPGLALAACALTGTGMTACALIPLFGALMSEQYPSRYIAPGIIALAMFAVVVHSFLVELFRDSAVFLDITYLVIVLILTLLFVLAEPYLLYAARRQLSSAGENERGSAPPAAGEAAKNAPEALDLLTKREREVLDLISYGHSNGDIARMLFISEHTVNDYTKNIYRKLGVHNRYAAAQIVNREEARLRGRGGDI
ncbi:MAG: helix-turn-helix transcriptional regulator [Oscillospiraceae bacterium]|nr:helix-turn-helix transcriptional regulator [Oscillospiraceae bacterium]